MSNELDEPFDIPWLKSQGFYCASHESAYRYKFCEKFVYIIRFEKIELWGQVLTFCKTKNDILKIIEVINMEYDCRKQNDKYKEEQIKREISKKVEEEYARLY